MKNCLNGIIQYLTKQFNGNVNDNKIVMPDTSIICNTRDRKNVSLTGIPRMVMEVLSNATEDYDRGEKMETYQKVGVSEYWIVDWRKKQVEIYLNDGREDGTTYFYLYKTVTEENKKELEILVAAESKLLKLSRPIIPIPNITTAYPLYMTSFSRFFIDVPD